MQQKQLKYALPWLLYIITLTAYVCFNLLEYSFFGVDRALISRGCVILMAVVIYLSLSTIVSGQAALGYIIYWILISTLAEYIYLSEGRFTHDEGATTILGVVPILVSLNWLIILFAVYSFTTFLSFLLKNNISRFKKFILISCLDGFVIILYALLIDPIGHHSGYFTWETSESSILVFGLVPLKIFFEYFIGIALVMSPIRYLEVFYDSPKKDAYQKKLSFPLYFSWSLFAALAYWAFRKDIPEVGNFGLILLLLITGFMVYKRRDIIK